jgi:hypothetical protein
MHLEISTENEYLNDLFNSSVKSVDIPGQRQLSAKSAYLSSPSQII